MTVELHRAAYDVRLGSLDEIEAKLRSEDYDVIRRTGVRGSVTIDRATWEGLGRPVSLRMTLEALEPVGDEPTLIPAPPAHTHGVWIDGGNDLRTDPCRCVIGKDHTDPNPWE